MERALVLSCQAHPFHGPSPPKTAKGQRGPQGNRRTLGMAPNQKDSSLIDTLRALVEPMRKDGPGDLRDRALPGLGFASGCRLLSSSDSTSGT
jgi:hypothetical protein